MTRQHYGDGCGELIEGEEPTYGYRAIPTPDGKSVGGPVRKFHQECFRTTFDYRQVDGAPRVWSKEG